MRRPFLLVGLSGCALVVAVFAFYTLIARRPAHISALVPEDFAFGVFSSSLNDLDELYEAPYRNRETNPAALRYGDPVNVPHLDGFDYDRPIGSFVSTGEAEIFLIPVRDAGAFEDAFEVERTNVKMRDPMQPAKNYLAVSDRSVKVRRGDKNDLVIKAAGYPLAGAGHPKTGIHLRLLLWYMFHRESPRKPPGIPVLARVALRIPKPVADRIANECDSVLLGIPLPRTTAEPVRIEGEIALRDAGHVARSAHLATELDLTNMVASFPHLTVLLVGGVLDEAGWRDVGLPLEVGDAAVAFAIVEREYHARRFNFLVAVRPSSPDHLRKLEADGHTRFLDAAPGTFKVIEDGSAKVRTAALEKAPAWLAHLLRSDAKKAPQLFVSTTSERGVWYCSIGSQAEGTVRHALACLRDKPELGLRRQKQVGDHKEFLRGPHVGVAVVTVQGLRALGYRMPIFEFASLGQPPAITATLDVDNLAHLDIRLTR